MLVDLLLQHGWSRTRAAERMNVSRATARKWVARFEAEGEAVVADRPATRQVVRYERDPPGELVHVDVKRMACAGTPSP